MRHHCGAEMVLLDRPGLCEPTWGCPYCDGSALLTESIARRVSEWRGRGDGVVAACRRVADEDGVSVESVEMRYWRARRR